jgi:hypothetical protein
VDGLAVLGKLAVDRVAADADPANSIAASATAAKTGASFLIIVLPSSVGERVIVADASSRPSRFPHP